ncbi:SOS response-associated peptidase [Enhygromyxa salina]|nr:SOS response-associated peptidase [Enhygromyxa salina]
MSLSAPNHRAAALLLADAVPGFEADGLSQWLAQSEYRPRYNIGPGQDHFIVRGRAGRPILDRGSWGLRGPERAGKRGKLVINARAETVMGQPLFRGPFATGRCLIPADGFFEWARRDSQRLPWWFHRRDDKALLFAAVLGPEGFSIITVPAAPQLQWIHARMPAILEADEVADWLGGDQRRAHALLRSSEVALASMRVSPSFNSVAHDQPIEPLPELTPGG